MLCRAGLRPSTPRCSCWQRAFLWASRLRQRCSPRWPPCAKSRRPLCCRVRRRPASAFCSNAFVRCGAVCRSAGRSPRATSSAISAVSSWRLSALRAAQGFCSLALVCKTPSTISSTSSMASCTTTTPLCAWIPMLPMLKRMPWPNASRPTLKARRHGCLPRIKSCVPRARRMKSTNASS